MKMGGAGGSDLGKLVAKMLTILRKSKKIVEMQNSEISELKDKIVKGLNDEEQAES
jgi:hypothetical protein